MTIITPPAPLPLRNVKWRLSYPMQVNRSGWTGTSKKVGLPGAQLWTVSGQFVTILGEANVKPWRSFFMSLSGQANSFPVYASESVQTSVTGVTVRPVPNAGNAVPLQGLPVSTTVLTAGNMITVTLPSGHRRLGVLIVDLVSDGSGNGSAYLGCDLGEIPAVGAAVELRQPFALMSLTSEPPGWDVDVGQLYSFALSAEEAR